MTWSDVTRAPKPTVVRQFGVVCLVVFGGLGLFQALARSRPVLGWSLVGFGAACLVLGLLAPRLLRWVYTGAMLVAFPIGFVVSQLMLAVLFFLVFTPMGAGLRMRGWDAMLRRRKPASPTEGYWEPKPQPTDPRRYLRQY